MIATFLAEAPLGGGKRELRGEVHRWAVFCDERVDVADLAPEIRAVRPPPRPERPRLGRRHAR